MARRAFIAGLLAIGLAAMASARNPVQTAGQEPGLPKILDLARKYCSKLEKAALDFVCQEKVKEESNTRKGPVGAAVMPGSDRWGQAGGMARKSAPPESFNTMTSFYNYMYVRKGGAITERRDLLKKNGAEIEQKDATLQTRHFKFNDVFFGPSMLLGEAAAAEHDYKFVENDKIKREPVVVVSCEAKPDRIGKTLTGRAWIRVNDGAVLRISWDPPSFSGWKEVEAIAEGLSMDPDITSETEFGIERSGIRFPTRDRTEESYKKGSMSFTRSMVTVTYDDYKFFTVETGIEIRSK